jgi:predicted transcriptional regulator
MVADAEFVEFIPLKRDFFKGPLSVQGQRRLELEKMILECEKRKLNLAQLDNKQTQIQEELSSLRSTIGKKIQTQDPETRKMTHWDYVLKEMVCMAEDFERETKKKRNDLKRNVKICKRALHEK